MTLFLRYSHLVLLLLLWWRGVVCCLLFSPVVGVSVTVNSAQWYWTHLLIDYRLLLLNNIPTLDCDCSWWWWPLCGSAPDVVACIVTSVFVVVEFTLRTEGPGPSVQLLFTAIDCWPNFIVGQHHDPFVFPWETVIIVSDTMTPICSHYPVFFDYPLPGQTYAPPCCLVRMTILCYIAMQLWLTPNLTTRYWWRCWTYSYCCWTDAITYYIVIVPLFPTWYWCGHYYRYRRPVDDIDVTLVVVGGFWRLWVILIPVITYNYCTAHSYSSQLLLLPNFPYPCCYSHWVSIVIRTPTYYWRTTHEHWLLWWPLVCSTCCCVTETDLGCIPRADMPMHGGGRPGDSEPFTLLPVSSSWWDIPPCGNLWFWYYYIDYWPHSQEKLQLLPHYPPPSHLLTDWLFIAWLPQLPTIVWYLLVIDSQFNWLCQYLYLLLTRNHLFPIDYWPHSQSPPHTIPIIIIGQPIGCYCIVIVIPSFVYSSQPNNLTLFQFIIPWLTNWFKLLTQFIVILPAIYLGTEFHLLMTPPRCQYCWRLITDIPRTYFPNELPRLQCRWLLYPPDPIVLLLTIIELLLFVIVNGLPLVLGDWYPDPPRLKIWPCNTCIVTLADGAVVVIIIPHPTCWPLDFPYFDCWAFIYIYSCRLRCYLTPVPSLVGVILGGHVGVLTANPSPVYFIYCKLYDRQFWFGIYYNSLRYIDDGHYLFLLKPRPKWQWTLLVSTPLGLLLRTTPHSILLTGHYWLFVVTHWWHSTPLFLLNIVPNPSFRWTPVTLYWFIYLCLVHYWTPVICWLTVVDDPGPSWRDVITPPLARQTPLSHSPGKFEPYWHYYLLVGAQFYQAVVDWTWPGPRWLVIPTPFDLVPSVVEPPFGCGHIGVLPIYLTDSDFVYAPTRRADWLPYPTLGPLFLLGSAPTPLPLPCLIDWDPGVWEAGTGHWRSRRVIPNCSDPLLIFPVVPTFVYYIITCPNCTPILGRRRYPAWILCIDDFSCYFIIVDLPDPIAPIIPHCWTPPPSLLTLFNRHLWFTLVGYWLVTSRPGVFIWTRMVGIDITIPHCYYLIYWWTPNLPAVVCWLLLLPFLLLVVDVPDDWFDLMDLLPSILPTDLRCLWYDFWDKEGDRRRTILLLLLVCIDLPVTVCIEHCEKPLTPRGDCIVFRPLIDPYRWLMHRATTDGPTAGGIVIIVTPIPQPGENWRVPTSPHDPGIEPDLTTIYYLPRRACRDSSRPDDRHWLLYWLWHSPLNVTGIGWMAITDGVVTGHRIVIIPAQNARRRYYPNSNLWPTRTLLFLPRPQPYYYWKFWLFLLLLKALWHGPLLTLGFPVYPVLIRPWLLDLPLLLLITVVGGIWFPADPILTLQLVVGFKLLCFPDPVVLRTDNWFERRLLVPVVNTHIVGITVAGSYWLTTFITYSVETTWTFIGPQLLTCHPIVVDYCLQADRLYATAPIELLRLTIRCDLPHPFPIDFILLIIDFPGDIVSIVGCYWLVVGTLFQTFVLQWWGRWQTLLLFFYYGYCCYLVWPVGFGITYGIYCGIDLLTTYWWLNCLKTVILCYLFPDLRLCITSYWTVGHWRHCILVWWWNTYCVLCRWPYWPVIEPERRPVADYLLQFVPVVPAVAD